MPTKKKTTKARAKKHAARPQTREQWEALFLVDLEERRATRSDADIAREIGVSRQAVTRWRNLLEIWPYVPPVESETPAADAPLRTIMGWRIRLHRARLEWTLEDLAEAVGGSWTRSAVLSAERARAGQRGLKPETLQTFAEALAVSPADLLLLPRQTALLPALDFQGGAASGAEEEWARMMKLRAPPLRTVIGVNVARWRCARSMTQTDLAAAVGWRQNRISYVEAGLSGKVSPGITLDTLATFAEALQVTPSDLARLPRQPALVPVESG